MRLTTITVDYCFFFVFLFFCFFLFYYQSRLFFWLPTEFYIRSIFILIFFIYSIMNLIRKRENKKSWLLAFWWTFFVDILQGNESFFGGFFLVFFLSFLWICAQQRVYFLFFFSSAWLPIIQAQDFEFINARKLNYLKSFFSRNI